MIIAFATVLSGCRDMSYIDDPFPPAQSDTQELAFSVNRFGSDMYEILSAECEADENIVFSPYSISSCLGMAYAGAEGQTASQMAAVMYYTLYGDTLHKTFGRLSKELIDGNTIDNATLQERQGYELTTRINSAGWLQRNYGITDNYTSVLQHQYNAYVQFVDFGTDYYSIDDEINSWCDNATQGKIPELVEEQDITSDTRLVLVNTVYIKGSWLYPFDENETADRPFYTRSGAVMSVPMMRQTASLGYAEDSLVQAISMRLADGTISLIIVLPREGMFDRVEQDLSPGGMYAVVKAMQQADVRCMIPRFAVRTRRRLNDNLKALGMTDAFGASADFSAITGGPNSLFISFVIHEAVMEVNEKGLEAAAATAVGMAEGVSEDPVTIVDFTADRPFFYALYDHSSDAVLFLGRVMVPENM